MNERRIQRLQEQIKARIAGILLRELADPEIGLVTISRVELDREFTVCKAYWSVLGAAKDKARTERALQRARGFVQREVGASLRTRSVPRLEFVFDESIAGAVRMQEILHDLRAERQARTGAQDEDAAPDAGAEQPPPRT